MKKLFFSLAVMVLSITSLSAETYQFKDFNSLDISSLYEVTVEKSNSWSVEVTASDDMVSYLDVRLKGTVLVLDVNKHKTLTAKKDSYIKAHICMPELYSIELSGMASLSCEDAFTTTGRFSIEAGGLSKISGLTVSASDVKLDASGDSKIEGLRITANSLDLDLGGLSQAVIAGKIDKADLDLGGATKVTYQAKTSSLSVDLSGTSKASIEGQSFDDVTIETGGTSSIDFTEGDAESLSIEASAASTVNAQTLDAERVNIDCSGASKVNVKVAKELDVDASAASHVTYITSGALDRDSRRVNAAASVTKVN